jgi:hypothetical protein
MKTKTPKNTLTIKDIKWHRNGVSGMGFYVVAFEDQEMDNNPMMAIVYEEPHHCSVIGLHLLQRGDFGRENCWRGDQYEPMLRRAIKAHEKLTLLQQRDRFPGDKVYAWMQDAVLPDPVTGQCTGYPDAPEKPARRKAVRHAH